MKRTEPIFQTHHVVYESKEHRQSDVTRRVRKGVHQVLTLIKRFNYLSDQEIDAIEIECRMKRVFQDEKGDKE